MYAAQPNPSKAASAYRSIGEAAQELGLQPHVLRYWESKFERFVKPVKRRDGRRLFRPADMQALRAIQALVHDQGMTLKGAAKLLGSQGVSAIANGRGQIIVPFAPAAEPDKAKARAGRADAQASELEARPSPARALQDSVRKAFGESEAEGNALNTLQALRDLSPNAETTQIKAGEAEPGTEQTRSVIGPVDTRQANVRPLALYQVLAELTTLKARLDRVRYTQAA